MAGRLTEIRKEIEDLASAIKHSSAIIKEASNKIEQLAMEIYYVERAAKLK
jgi:hypothetical protein